MFRFKKICLKQFTEHLAYLDRNSKLTFVKTCEYDKKAHIIDSIGEHIEIENAIAMIKDSPLTNYIVFRSSNTDDINYRNILTNLFDKVICIENLNGVENYMVCGCTEGALEAYNILKQNGKINKYVTMFESYKNKSACDDMCVVYKVESNIRTNVPNDKYLKWCINALKINSYISLSVCGFTLNDIEKNHDLQALFSMFHNIYVILCKDVSVGAYILKNSF